MKTINILRWFRNNVTGLSAIQIRFDILQSKLDVLMGVHNTRRSSVNDINKKSGAKVQVQESVNSQTMNTSYSDVVRAAELVSDENTRTVLYPNEAVRVVFIIQHPSIWSSWRSVWDAANKDSRFHPKVILTPFKHPFSSEALTYDDTRQLLIDENVSFTTVDFFNLNECKPHVVFVQNPYENTRPEFLKIENIKKSGAKIAYIPYGLEMGGGAWNIAAQFDLALHRSAWKIFVRSERHKKMFAKHCRAGNGHVVITGHPKFDCLNTAEEGQLCDKTTRKIGERKVLLWTPHFSVGTPATWSTYKLYSEFIISEMHRRCDLFLLIRPHPMFFQAMLQHEIWDKDGEQSFRLAVNNSANMALDESLDHRASFSISDALMTDVGSFLLEYIPTGKPLLYLHHPDGLGMNDDEDLVCHLYTASNLEGIEKFIDMVENSEDPLKVERKSVLPEFLYGLDSNIGESICQHIYSAISTGDFSSPSLSQASTEQADSENYWKDASDTYLAPPDYYDYKETILDELLDHLPSYNAAIDIGCGDGRFTFLLAKYVNDIVAYDISPSLVEKAKEAASSGNIHNIHFEAQELEAIAPLEKYDLVACMGVTSCIIADIKFLSIIDKLKTLSRDGGHLLLIDTLSSDQEQMASDQNGYIAKYRAISDYRALISRRGYVLRKEILIKEIKERKLVNKLFLFEFKGSHLLGRTQSKEPRETFNTSVGVC